MKRVLLFTIIISFIGYSKNPNLPNHPNFKNDLQQELVERMNPLNLEFGDDGMMDLKLTQRITDVKLQSLQSEMIVQSDNDITYRLDGYTSVSFNENDLTSKTESTYDENGNRTLIIYNSWDTNTQSFVPIYKREYTYDENGNTTLYINNNSWDTNTQSFVPTNKYEYTYDENGKRTLYIHYSWDTTTQSFVLNTKYEYTYDENGNQTIRIYYTWDTNTESFVPNTKHEYTYDENGNQTISIYYTWDTNTESFVPNNKYEYTYDENGNETLRIRYNWDTTTQSFVPNNKYENTYDENGNRTLFIYYNWDTTTQSFVPNQKFEYTYDENGNNTLMIYYGWDTNTQSFVPTNKYEYTYDENGKRTLYIRYYWNITTQSFVPTNKYEYTYDENGNQTLYIISSWDTTTQSFVPVMKDVNTYDYTFHPYYKTQRKTEKYHNGIGYKPSFVQDYSIHSESDTELVILGITKQYDTNSNTWSELQGEEFKSYWYYTKTPSLSTNSVEPNLFSIYPNPTSNTLKINSSEYLKTPIFEIYDVKGSKVLSNPFKLTEPIDVSDLQPSMYIYYVKDDNEVKQSGKVLIE